jgi:biopolymer transport protein ExbB
MNESAGLVGILVSLPIFEAEWVLWLLIGLSLASVAVMIERWWFYRRHRVDADAVRAELDRLLDAGNYKGAAEYLQRFDSLETNVTLFGLRQHQRGPDAVQDLLSAAETNEKLRYQRRLAFLATVGSNAPFIGLFGTVLGIIRAFKDLAGNMADASGTVMAGISEALIATAVGLLVAIPAVIAYNLFVGKVKDIAANGELLSRTLLSQLKSVDGGA